MARGVVGQAGRIVAAAGLTIALAAAGPAQDDPVRGLAGRYTREYPIPRDNGELLINSDEIQIVPVDAGHAYVSVRAGQRLRGSCTLSGVATGDAGALVYHEPATDKGGGECRMRIRRLGDRLVADDANGSCRDYCSANTGLSADVPWGSRRPLTNLARIRNSKSYADAIKEWRAR